MKKIHFVLLVLGIIALTGFAYIAGSANKNNDQVVDSNSNLPTYFLAKQTIIGEGNNFPYSTSVEIKKVENGVTSNGSEISGALFSDPYETKDGYKVFITERNGVYQFYSLDSNGKLEEIGENPFSVFYSGNYRVVGENDGAGSIPVPLRDSTFTKIGLTTIGTATTEKYSASDYGDYSEINFVGVSLDKKYAYFFIDNFFPSGNEIKSAVVRQNLADKKDYSFILSASSTNETLNSSPERLEFLVVSGHSAFFKYASDDSRWADEQNEISIIKLNLNTGEFSDIGSGFKSSQIFVFSQDRSYMLVRDDPSVSAEQMMYIYNTNDGTYIKSMNALTCNQRAISNSGKYIAESCPGTGEDKILNVETGESTTVATYERPIDDSGYEVGYSETTFLTFKNLPE